MAEKQKLTHRTAEIFDTLVYIYDSEDGNEDEVQLAQDNFKMMRSDIIQQASLATKAAKDYVTKKFESSYLYSLMLHLEPSKPVSVKVRDVIVSARTTADSMLYLAVQVLQRRNSELPDTERIQLPGERMPDFFDDSLKNWLDCLGKLPCFGSSANPGNELLDLLGFIDINQRQPWVQTLKKLSDRFVHRGVFFLQTDFNEMQRVLPNRELEKKAFAGESSAKQMDENETFCRFIVYVNTRIEKLAKLSSDQ